MIDLNNLPSRLCKNLINLLSDFEKFKALHFTRKQKDLLMELLLVA